jgi:hypothetical protein
LDASSLRGKKAVAKFEIPANPWSGGAGLPLGFHHNNGDATCVFLTRDHKLTGSSRNRYIPYVVIRAITLISILRLGLVDVQKERAYKEFVKLPLYEDMVSAP